MADRRELDKAAHRQGNLSRAMMMSTRRTASLLPLGLAASLLGSCGSRTPLDADPIEDTLVADASLDGDALDGGEDSEIDRCLSDAREIGDITIDLFFTMDRSLSMRTVDRGSTTTRWEAVSQAMASFVNSSSSAGLGAGIEFFPRLTPDGANYCTGADYAFPVVPIGPLPGVAPSILKAISFQTLAPGTPTTQALDGAHVYVRGQQLAHPNHTLAVVMVTDGYPRSCGSSVEATAAVAAGAASGTPPIHTYVLGVGPNLVNLNAIAQAGGTSQAYLAESGGETSLLAALESIRTSALKCEMVLPLRNDGRPRLDVTRVSTTVAATGESANVEQVAMAEACAGGPGWFFDNPVPPADPPPTKILLCPSSCVPLVKRTGTRLAVALGCTRAP